MLKALKLFKDARLQTKLFVLTFALYIIALLWTTIQAYARLEYSRTGISRPIVIEAEPSDKS